MARKFSFSYSQWSLWKKCPRAYKYAKVDKLPEPKSPAMEKGLRVHKALEDYVTGKVDERPKEAAKFTTLVDGLRALPPEFKRVEQQMAFDRDQRPCTWFGPNAYARYIWDVAVLDDPARPQQVVMGDYKTGRPYGSYDDQLQLFAIPAYLLFPSLQSFVGNLIYLDTGDTVRVEYTRHQFENGLNDLWKSNAAMMEADQAFEPKPSRDACRFCSFSTHKGGPCNEGVC